jgi:hypothetical protein
MGLSSRGICDYFAERSMRCKALFFPFLGRRFALRQDDWWTGI